MSASPSQDLNLGGVKDETDAPAPEESLAPTPPLDAADAANAGVRLSRPLLLLALAVLVLALLLSTGLWFKLSDIQEQLAKQSADSGATAVEAKAYAKAAQELARETAARQSLMDTRLAEVALQRTQLEELMQSLARSRDENLVADIDSALRLAQQQAQLTGSVEPLLTALKSAEQRLARAAQLRLNPVHRAINKDIERIKSTAVTDVPHLLQKLDELAFGLDELPLANQYLTHPDKAASAKASSQEPDKAGSDKILAWVDQGKSGLQQLWQDLQSLVRVARMDQPDAVLLTPEHSFFLRENIKLKVLNMRLGVMSRQFDVARSDAQAVQAALARYFDLNARSTQSAQALLQQVVLQMKAVQLPRIDDSLAALNTAAAGR